MYMLHHHYIHHYDIFPHADRTSSLRPDVSPVCCCIFGRNSRLLRFCAHIMLYFKAHKAHMFAIVPRLTHFCLLWCMTWCTAMAPVAMAHDLAYHLLVVMRYIGHGLFEFCVQEEFHEGRKPGDIITRAATNSRIISLSKTRARNIPSIYFFSFSEHTRDTPRQASYRGAAVLSNMFLQQHDTYFLLSLLKT